MLPEVGRHHLAALVGTAVLVVAATACASSGHARDAGPSVDRAPRLRADSPRAAIPDASACAPMQPPHVHEIIEAGPGFVAVGATDAFDDRADIWTSSDGRTWTRVTGTDLGFGAIDDVTVGGPGLVAVGKGTRSYFHGAVWTSRDGRTWTRLPVDPVFARSRIRSVTAGGPGLVAVGMFNRAWFSSDGVTWERASVPPVPSDVYPGDDRQTPQVAMGDVAAIGDRLVAVGSAMLKDGSDRAVIWTSMDGLAWTDVPLDPEVFPTGTSLLTVTGTADGFIAAEAEASNGRTRRWRSPDGSRWSRIESGVRPPASTGPSPAPTDCP